MALDDEDWAIAKVAQRLCARFEGIESEVVERVVDECRSDFDGRPVRTFVAVLVEKMARDRLRSLGPTPPARSKAAQVSPVGHDQWIRRALGDAKPWAVL
jgi:hypothetical protein